MDSIIIAWNNRGSDKNLRKVRKYVKSFSTWSELSESIWFVKSPLSSKYIRDELTRLVAKGDIIFVAKLTGDAAWQNTLAGDEFLLKNL